MQNESIRERLHYMRWPLAIVAAAMAAALTFPLWLPLVPQTPPVHVTASTTTEVAPASLRADQ